MLKSALHNTNNKNKWKKQGNQKLGCAAITYEDVKQDLWAKQLKYATY